MKVVILCSNLEAGGAQRAAIRLCAEFRKINIDCENWFLYTKSEAFLDAPNLKIILPRKIKSGFDYFKILIKLFSAFRKHKPYAVISFLHYSNILGLTVARLSNVKIRVASHRNISTGDMSKPLRILDAICAATGIYTCITAVSESTKRSFGYYSKSKFEKIKVIHNGLNYIPSKLDVSEARVNFNLPLDKTILGNIGRLSMQKNQKLLVDVLTKANNVHLAIVGDGKLKAELLERAQTLGVESRLHLLGEVATKEIPDFFKAIDFFVMPSLFEGLSNALIEALNAGVPILASDIDAQRDVIVTPSGAYAGILLPVDDAAAWGNAVLKLMNNEVEKKAISKIALLRAQDFSMENMVNGFLLTMPDIKYTRN